MVEIADILQFVDAVAVKFRPQRIVLFGSYAYGAPGDDSDVDLLVVKEFRGKNHEQIVRIRRAIDFNFPMDLLVHREKDIARRIGWNDCFLKEVTEKGLVLYDANDPRVGGKGRKRLRDRRRTRAVA
jgi:predicted nucleotidyltransferase